MSSLRKVVLIIGALAILWSLTNQDQVLVQIPSDNIFGRTGIWQTNFFLIITRSLAIAIVTTILFFIMPSKQEKKDYNANNDKNLSEESFKYCGKCGKVVTQGNNFCGHCGFKLDDKNHDNFKLPVF